MGGPTNTVCLVCWTCWSTVRAAWGRHNPLPRHCRQLGAGAGVVGDHVVAYDRSEDGVDGVEHGACRAGGDAVGCRQAGVRALDVAGLDAAECPGLPTLNRRDTGDAARQPSRSQPPHRGSRPPRTHYGPPPRRSPPRPHPTRQPQPRTQPPRRSSPPTLPSGLPSVPFGDGRSTDLLTPHPVSGPRPLSSVVAHPRPWPSDARPSTRLRPR